MEVRTVRDLATAIRGRRTDVGWSQHDLANRADVSRSWLANLERGKPSAEVLRLLSLPTSLGLTLDITPTQRSSDVEVGRRPHDSLDLDEHLRRYE